MRIAARLVTCSNLLTTVKEKRALRSKLFRHKVINVREIFRAFAQSLFGRLYYTQGFAAGGVVIFQWPIRKRGWLQALRGIPTIALRATPFSYANTPRHFSFVCWELTIERASLSRYSSS